MASQKVTKSTEKSGLACGLCGKSIPTPSGVNGKWCSGCQDILIQCLVSSFNQAGKLDQAQETLTHLMDHRQNENLQYYLGLIKAQRGDFDGSIEALRGLVGSIEDNPEFRLVLAKVLASRASQHIKNKNYDHAVQDLAFSVEMNPGDPNVEYSLSLARSVEAILHTNNDANDEALEKVIQMFQRIQIQQPDNNIIAHYLAIFSYRRASEAEEGGKQKVADLAWRNTIANWSLLFSSELFWEQWAEREKNSYRLNATGDDIKNLRTELRERLLQDFRIYRTQYGEIRDDKAVRRHHEYEVLLLLEIKTASAMRKVFDIFRQKNVTPTLSISCGPLMLENLKLTSAAQEIISIARNNRFSEERVSNLENCISSKGRIGVLIETNWLDQAETELDALLAKSPWDAGLISQMILTVSELAKQLAATEKFDEAVKKLEKGFRYAKKDAGLQELAATICLDESKRIAASGKHEEVINKIVKVLEMGLELSPLNSPLQIELATRYAERANVESGQKNTDAAIKDLKKAFALERTNGLALRFAETIYNNMAVELGNATRYTEAINVVNEGLQYVDSDLLKTLLFELRRRRGW